MIRRALGCLEGCLALVLAVVLFAIGLTVFPAARKEIPQATQAIGQAVSALQRDFRSAGNRLPLNPASLSPTFTQPSASDCQWGEGVLLEDRALDLQGAVQYPQVATWYQQTAGWWESAYTDLQGLCGVGVPPSSQACATDLTHFQQAYSTHQNAAGSAGSTGVPDNTQADQAWNSMWLANYQRLESIWTATRCAS